MFCCVGGGPKQLFKVKLWKSPTVNIGLASATGKSGRMCKSHLDSFHNSSVIGGQRCHPNRWWVLSALKDITHSSGEALQMLKHKQNRGDSVLPIIAIFVGNIITFMHSLTVGVVCVHVCDDVFVCVFFLLLFLIRTMYSEVGYLCKNKLNNIGFHPNPLIPLPTTRPHFSAQ